MSQHNAEGFELTAADQAVYGSAKFSDDTKYRFDIRRWWNMPTRWAVWLMLNPSFAGAKTDDMTAQRVTHFTRAWGYTGWIGVNIYPFRSSIPKKMWEWSRWADNGPDWSAHDALVDNERHIEIAARQASIRIVAFGAEPVLRDELWLEQCLERFGQPSDIGADCALYCLGTSSSGQPLHPMARGRMRVPDNARPVRWVRP